MLKNSREYMPTYVLIAANVAVYAYTSVLSQSLTTNDYITTTYGQFNYYVSNG